MCIRDRPGLLDGSAQAVPQDLSKGAYFGGRRAEDGRIDWTQDAKRVHDLVRAVAPPYPGAFTQLDGKRLRVLRTRVLPDTVPRGAPVLQARAGRLVAHCADGRLLHLLECELDGAPFTAAQLGARSIALGGDR